MKTRLFTISIFITIILLLGCNKNKPINIQGNLIIIGGGERPASIMKKFVDLAGGEKAKIAIIPMASSYYKEVGPEYEQEFLNYGAAEVKAFYIQNKTEANQDSLIAQLSKYSGIFFSGGDQNKLTDIFNNTKFLSFLQTTYKNGLTIGGTSAGAAIMSDMMITGDGNWNVLMKDSVKTTKGFGLVNEAVIDQHFFKRRRFNRLLNVSLQHSITGIGIDESTAIWVKNGNEVEILGKSVVLVINPEISKKNEVSNLLTGKNILLDVYKNGDIFRLN